MTRRITKYFFLWSAAGSGINTRTCGGAKPQPFLIDSSLSAEGYAFLTSSKLKNKIIFPRILLSLRALHGTGNLSPIYEEGGLCPKIIIK
jgi:hypothetical protein